MKTGPNSIERLLVVGGGNAAVQVIDALQGSPSKQPLMILDDNRSLHGTSVMGVPVVGGASLDKALALLRKGEYDSVVIAVGSVEFRSHIFSEWKQAGIPFANVVHPTVHVGTGTAVGTGNVIMAFCHIGAFSRIEDNNLFSAFSDIEHHCRVGSHCSFGPGVFLSGNVIIGDGVRTGTGIFIEPNISVGSDSVIASGVALVSDVPPRTIVKTKSNLVMRPRN